jgi:hypothetical protein
MVRPFFDLRPAPMLPVADPRFIALESASHGLLHAPVQLAQDAPYVSGMIFDAEALLDQIGNPGARPQRSLITQALGTLQQQLDQSRLVGFAQTRQPSRPPGCPQSHVTALLMLLAPPTDGLVAYFQSPADLTIIEIFAE